ncbi:MAG: DNA translocase FtsK [Clostridiales bacterium]|nr:DNA translocase FtsK [Candidatus Crickella caballi]
MLVKGFGRPGLFIFAVAVLIISIFLVANTPISKFFENLSNKRETKRMMAELEAAEQAKVQMAVASTATPGVNPDTGVLPQMDRSPFIQAPVIEPVAPVKAPEIQPVFAPAQASRVIQGSREADLNDTLVTDKTYKKEEIAVQPQPAQSASGLRSLFRKNAAPEKKSDENRYDHEDVGADVAKAIPPATKTKSYGLGNPDEIGHSGSYGLGGYDEYESSRISSGNSGMGLDGDAAASIAYSTVEPELAAVEEALSKPAAKARKPKRVISNGVDSAATSAATAAAAATIATKANENKEEEVNTDDVAQDLNAGFNSASDDSGYELPPVSLLKKGTSSKHMMTEVQLEEKADLLESTLRDYGVNATVSKVTQGASVTRYEVQPATGVKVSSITRLADDIALNLSAKSIRIEAPIPGKPAVGIEVESDKPAPVLIRDLIESEEFQNAESKISFVVGKDISGNNIVADLKGMPHLLIAGATGSGKSICINTIIASFLYKAKPSELKLIMIDPKVVELANYNGIPHMLTPVVTDARKASRALALAVEEMDKRYELFAKYRVKDLISYNEYMRAEHEPQKCKPEIVIIIDELADLMMAAPSEVENSICRLAQKARAAGMHLIVATQRPSVDVVTGLIKANIPSRIAFSVSSQVDSRTILDMAGAEKLLGKGDMLFSPVGSTKPIRVQGPFISETESDKIVRFVKKEGGEAEYDEEVKNAIDNADKKSNSEPEDELTEDAIEAIFKAKQASVSMLQRRFRIGYNRAARIIDEIEAKGIIGPQDGARPRQLLMTEEEYYGIEETENTVEAAPPEEVIEEAVIEDAVSEVNDIGHTAAYEAFDSLPESVRKSILDADSEEEF